MVIISLVSPFRKSERRRLITWVIFSAQKLCFLGNFQRVPTPNLLLGFLLREVWKACPGFVRRPEKQNAPPFLVGRFVYKESTMTYFGSDITSMKLW